MFSRVLCAVAVVSGVMAQNPPFPKIPDDFSAHIEANIDEKNYTLDLKEYYDFSNERFRIEMHRNGSYHTELCDMKGKTHYVVDRFPGKQFNCTVQNVSNCRTGPSGPHMTRASEFLTGHAGNWTYDGTAKTRGIVCDTWVSNATLDMSKFPGRPRPPGSPPRPSLIKYDLKWHFHKPYWSNRGVEDSVRPVALHMTGVNLDAQGAQLSTFEHWYNFIDFMPTFSAVNSEHLANDLFMPSPQWKCPGMKPPSDTAVKCGPDTENKNGVCMCKAKKPIPTASSYEVLESHKTLVAVLPAVAVMAAVKFFM